MFMDVILTWERAVWQRRISFWVIDVMHVRTSSLIPDATNTIVIVCVRRMAVPEAVRGAQVDGEIVVRTPAHKL